MCRPVRRFASAAVLLLVLALPAAAAGAKAPPASAAPVVVEVLVVGGLRWLWQAAVHLVTPAGDSGPEMDPDG